MRGMNTSEMKEEEQVESSEEVEQEKKSESDYEEDVFNQTETA